jgi:hypothetical protein
MPPYIDLPAPESRTRHDFCEDIKPAAPSEFPRPMASESIVAELLELVLSGTSDRRRKKNGIIGYFFDRWDPEHHPVPTIVARPEDLANTGSRASSIQDALVYRPY